jgi:RNA polymerase sigma-70 factor (ECF subfamily)
MIASSATIKTEAIEAIIERAIAGDEVAFARIVAAHNDDMARIAYLVSGSLDVAEDAVQAAWAIAWRRLGSLRDPTRLRPWLMSVVEATGVEECANWRSGTVRDPPTAITRPSSISPTPWPALITGIGL